MIRVPRHCGRVLEVLFVDHYDSFSFNLIDWLRSGHLQVSVEHVYYDQITPGMLSRLSERRGKPIVLSPGPKHPEDGQQTLQLIAQQMGKVPIFGICLGHQMLAVSLGGMVRRGLNPRHGVRKNIVVDRDSMLFKGEVVRHAVACYHSLVAESSEEASFDIIGRFEESGEIAALQSHGGGWKACGVQFHPESFLTEGLSGLRANWLDYAYSYHQSALRESFGGNGAFANTFKALHL